MTALHFTLPYPPSVNTYWRHPTKGPLAGRHLISEAGRNYRTAVQSTLQTQGYQGQRLAGRLTIDIEAFMPDRRKRDLDNILKALLDSLTFCGVWDDDSQIHDLRIRRGDLIAGMVKVQISQFKE